MQLPGGMLYAEGKSNSNWNWRVARIIPIVGEERLKYPVIGKEGEYHTQRLDVDNAKTFSNDKFALALDELYSVVKEQHETQQ